jgi:hypothetical protein
MINNQKGMIALAIILSMLLVIGAIAVFGLVSGRFSTTYRLNNRAQALLDAESASYVAYMLMREGVWERDAADADSKEVQFGHKTVVVDISDETNNSVRARSGYR